MHNFTFVTNRALGQCLFAKNFQVIQKYSTFSSVDLDYHNQTQCYCKSEVRRCKYYKDQLACSFQSQSHVGLQSIPSDRGSIRCTNVLRHQQKRGNNLLFCSCGSLSGNQRPVRFYPDDTSHARKFFHLAWNPWNRQERFVYDHRCDRQHQQRRNKSSSTFVKFPSAMSSSGIMSIMSPTDPMRSDDISALSMGFERVVLRRRLSTVSDQPTLLERRNSETDSSPGGVGFPWVEGQTRISECSEGSDEASSDGEKPSKKSADALFSLLDKVIAFRGRNVSHITVEQAVKDLCTIYNETEDSDKQRFFVTLAESYGVDHENVSALGKSLIGISEENALLNIEEKLRQALVPQYQWLFSQIGRLENGVKFLVDFRTDLLDAVHKYPENAMHLKSVSSCLRDLIGMWFAVGFLNLERVTWQSSCDMLQKISEYEAVHPMRNWTDLKQRVGPYRRCFVFTHGSMPSEPVVVLHTALTDNIPSSIRKIVTQKQRMLSLDADSDMMSTGIKEDSGLINTAIFYSITSTQRGLMGIELGNYLIKSVVRELQSEFPKMNQFSSLSPIPGFKNWLMGELKTCQKDPGNQKLFTPQELNLLAPLLNVSTTNSSDIFKTLQDSLKFNDWHADNGLVCELETPLMRLCAQYLVIVKRRGYAMDAVANFHLKNGAVIWRLNWLGDPSPRGLGQSCGIMVNYRYFLDACETNSQNYMENHTIELSDQVRHLVRLAQSELTSKI